MPHLYQGIIYKPFQTGGAPVWFHTLEMWLDYGKITCFSNNGLNMLPWTSFTCYTKDNQQGCFRLSNWFSLRRLGPLASCMIVHFSAHISKWELVCKFGVIFHIFIISCLCPRFHVWNLIFLLCNNLFIYQVLCTLIYRRRSLYSFLYSVYFYIWFITVIGSDNGLSPGQHQTTIWTNVQTI